MKNLKTSRTILSVLHGTILFVMLWVINSYTSYSASVDEGLLKRIFLFEDLLFPKRFVAPHDFVFVNVSRDISLINDPQEYGLISITDRKKLSSFFAIFAANENRHRFILCDIFFEYPSAEDSLLIQQISQCKNLLFPYHYANGSILKPCVNVPSALADYQTYSDKFSKFRLTYDDSVKTIPLVLYNRLNKSGRSNTWLALNTIAPRYYIRPYHLFVSNKYPYFNLGELLQLSADPSFYEQYLKDKFVVMGDFETKSDEHDTPIGKMYGPLILINTYLSLAAGRASPGIVWAIFLFASLSATSYILFFVKLKPPQIRFSPWVDFIIHHVLNRVFSFLTICALIVFISEFVFSVQLFISPLFLYLIYISWAIDYYKTQFQMPRP